MKNKYIILIGTGLILFIASVIVYFNWHTNTTEVTSKNMYEGQNNNIDEMPVIELSKKQLNDIHTKTNKIVQMLHKDLQDSKSFKNINLKSVESSPSNKKLNKKLAFLITINVQAPVKKPDKQAKKLGHDVETSIHQLMESKKMKAVLKKDTYVIKVYSKDGKLLN